MSNQIEWHYPALIECNGKRHTVKDWADIRGIKESTLWTRIQRGWTIEEALEFKKRRRTRTYKGRDINTIKDPLTYNGVTLSRYAWARERNIHPNTLSKRIALGWPVDEALEFTPRVKPRRNKNSRLYTANGETKSLTEWANALDVRPQLLYNRLHNGWTIDEALGFTPRKKKQRRNITMVTYKGKRRTIKQWADKYDIKPVTLSARLRRGWSIEEALEITPRSISNDGRFGAKSKTYMTCYGQTKSLTEWSEISQLSPETITHRIQQDWSTEAALGFKDKDDEQ